jgi:3-dehydroquinate dehydratase
MICIPITGNTQEEALHQIEMSLSRAQVLELRMDMISGDLGTLMEKCRAYPIPVRVLVTNRGTESSSSKEISGEGRRIATLKEALRLGADYVDV